MNSADSAEELVKIYLDGVEMALRISGTGAKNIAMMLIAMAKEHEQTRGKTRLSSLLKSGKPLKIFTIASDELKTFSKEAKKYGILYSALANKKNSKIDGMVDIMIKEEDAGKMNRLAERFNFKDLATIKNEMAKEKEEKLAKMKGKSEEEIFIDEIMPTSKKEEKEIPSGNKEKTEEKNPLESSLNIKQHNSNQKPSVLKELSDIIKEKEKEKENNGKRFKDEKTTLYSKGKRHKEKDKSRNKGKRYKEPKHLKQKSKNKKERGK